MNMEIIDIKEESKIFEDFSFGYEDQLPEIEHNGNNQFYTSNENIFIEPDPSTIVKVDASLLQEIDEIKVENPCDEIDIEYHQIELKNESDVSVSYESDIEFEEYGEIVESEQIKTTVHQISENENKCKSCGMIFKRQSALKAHELIHDLDNESSTDEKENSSYNDTKSDCSDKVDYVVRSKVQRNKKYTKSRRKSSEQKILSENIDDTGNQELKLKTFRKQRKVLQHSTEKATSVKSKKIDINSEDNYSSETTSDPVESANTVSEVMDKSLNSKNTKNKCDQCGLCFTVKCHLFRHIKSVHLNMKHINTTTKRKLICALCGKSCRGPCGLKYHMNQHKGITPFKCKCCKKQFYSPEGLSTHMRSVHYDEWKPRYRPSSNIKQSNKGCSICNQVFGSIKYLKLHIRKHTGDRTHDCPKCGKHFVEPSKLKIHLKMKRSCVARKVSKKVQE